MKEYLDGRHHWDLCANCGHLQVSHTNWDLLPLSKAPELKWVSRCKVTHDGPIKLPAQCTCTEWVPKDNLDRIEFLAEKRSLV